jgi:hypothetical protein
MLQHGGVGIVCDDNNQVDYSSHVQSPNFADSPVQRWSIASFRSSMAKVELGNDSTVRIREQETRVLDSSLTAINILESHAARPLLYPKMEDLRP